MRRQGCRRSASWRYVRADGHEPTAEGHLQEGVVQGRQHRALRLVHVCVCVCVCVCAQAAGNQQIESVYGQTCEVSVVMTARTKHVTDALPGQQERARHDTARTPRINDTSRFCCVVMASGCDRDLLPDRSRIESDRSRALPRAGSGDSNTMREWGGEGGGGGGGNERGGSMCVQKRDGEVARGGVPECC